MQRVNFLERSFLKVYEFRRWHWSYEILYKSFSSIFIYSAVWTSIYLQWYCLSQNISLKESFRCWFNKLSVSHGLDHNQRWDSVRNCNEQRYLQHLEKTIWNVQLSHVKFSYMTIYDMFCMRNVYIITLACKIVV